MHNVSTSFGPLPEIMTVASCMHGHHCSISCQCKLWEQDLSSSGAETSVCDPFAQTAAARACCWKYVLGLLSRNHCPIAIGQLISPDLGQTMHCGHSQCLHSAAKAPIEAAEPSNFVAQMLCSQAAVQRLVSLPAPGADSYVRNEAHAVSFNLIGRAATCCKQLCIPSGEVENAFDALGCLPAYAHFQLWKYVCQVLPMRALA